MVIVPTYNERNNVAPLVRRIRKAVRFEPILFIDDSSPDGTSDEIRRMQQCDGAIELMVRPDKSGFGSAYRDAMKKILRENLVEYVITLDADLSHPPEMLPQMIELLKDNSVVIGSRYVAGGGTQDWSIPRHVLSLGANIYARLLTGVPVHDLTAGFVGYRADALRAINLDEIRSEGYAFQMEMKFNLYRNGNRFCEFPIVFSERHAGKSKFTTKILTEGIAFPIRAFATRIQGLA
jgi:dolichol-phosphate mannosyltransferase